ncbi:MAG: bifunctional 2-keto-4-hydroxyglutarate aldolase/2-keto-3-deoxy-6-phosphogluconate aldolase [Bacillota bacterium]
MKKSEILQKVVGLGIVAVIRAETSEKACSIVEAVRAGGISAIEITMTVPGAIEVIKEVARKFINEDIIIGVGSVLDSETARSAILAGAQYVVSPHLNPGVIKLCNRYQVPCMPGAMSVKEVVEAMELGAEIVKVFPGEVVGPSFIKAVKGPLPQANMMPTGGVSLENVRDWFLAGAVALGVGGSLTKGAKTGDYNLVTETAKKFVEKVNEARAGL